MWLERTRKAVVVAIGQFVVDEHGDRIVLFLQLLPHGPGIGLGHLEAGPAVPLETCGLGQPTEARDQAPRGHGEGVLAIVGALDGDWQAVGDEEQAAR